MARMYDLVKFKSDTGTVHVGVDGPYGKETLCGAYISKWKPLKSYVRITCGSCRKILERVLNGNG